MTAEARADETAMELSVRLAEDRAFARRMRLVMQTALFTDPAFDYLTRPIVHAFEKFERQIAESPDRVA